MRASKQALISIGDLVIRGERILSGSSRDAAAPLWNVIEEVIARYVYIIQNSRAVYIDVLGATLCAVLSRKVESRCENS